MILHTWRVGLGRSQQKCSIESIAFVPFEPNTTPINRLQNIIISKTRKTQIERDGKFSYREECIQEIIVGAIGDKVMDALNWGALEDGPLATEEGDQY